MLDIAASCVLCFGPRLTIAKGVDDEPDLVLVRMPRGWCEMATSKASPPLLPVVARFRLVFGIGDSRTSVS